MLLSKMVSSVSGPISPKLYNPHFLFSKYNTENYILLVQMISLVQPIKLIILIVSAQGTNSLISINQRKST